MHCEVLGSNLGLVVATVGLVGNVVAVALMSLMKLVGGCATCIYTLLFDPLLQSSSLQETWM